MAVGTKWLCAVVPDCFGVRPMPTLEMQNPGDITHEETKQDRIDEKMLEGLDIGKHWSEEMVRTLRGNMGHYMFVDFRITLRSGEFHHSR